MDQGSPSQPLQSQVSPRDLRPPPLPCSHSASFEVTRRCLPVPQYAAHWRRDIWTWWYWEDFMIHPFPTAPWPWCPCRPPSFLSTINFQIKNALVKTLKMRSATFTKRSVCGRKPCHKWNIRSGPWRVSCTSISLHRSGSLCSRGKPCHDQNETKAFFFLKNLPAVKPSAFHLVTWVRDEQPDGVGSDFLPIGIYVDCATFVFPSLNSHK